MKKCLNTNQLYTCKITNYTRTKTTMNTVTHDVIIDEKTVFPLFFFFSHTRKCWLRFATPITHLRSPSVSCVKGECLTYIPTSLIFIDPLYALNPSLSHTYTYTDQHTLNVKDYKEALVIVYIAHTSTRRCQVKLHFRLTCRVDDICLPRVKERANNNCHVSIGMTVRGDTVSHWKLDENSEDDTVTVWRHTREKVTKYNTSEFNVHTHTHR